jgi:hypothetical protein
MFVFGETEKVGVLKAIVVLATYQRCNELIKVFPTAIVIFSFMFF